jgi:hypothetical protein
MFERLFPGGVVPPTFKLPPVWGWARIAATTATDFTHLDTREEKARICNLLRDITGNPFRPLPPIPATVLTRNDGIAVKLAGRIYDERDFVRESMGVLADALEEAGLADEEVLSHLRGSGPHTKGCWAVDVILGRE